MVLDHVAQHARLLVVGAPPLHAQLLGHGDLHVVHVAAVPDGLEEAVGEAEDEDVLHRLLAQVVVDAEDLVLLQLAAEVGVEGARAVEVAAEGLLHDDAPPGVALLAGEAGLAQLAHQRGEGVRRGGQVEEGVAARPVLAVELGQALAQPHEGGRVIGGTGDAVEAVAKVGPGGRVDLAGGEGLDVLRHELAEALVVHGLAHHAHEGELPRQEAVRAQVVERGQELAPGEVARGAEDDDGARVAGAGQAFGAVDHARDSFRTEP